MKKFILFLSIFSALFFTTTIDAFLFHHKEKCEVSVYKGGKDFSGDNIMANKSFVPYLKSIGGVAKSCKVRVHVTGSFKQLKSPTEYVLSSQMPLALGRGIHFDLESPKGAVVCNRLCMITHSWKKLPDAACFMENVQKKGIHFSEPNLLHDGFASKASAADLETLKVATQKLCASKTKEAKS